MPHLVLFGLYLMIDGKLRCTVILRKSRYLNTLLRTKINWRAFETNFRNTEMDFAFSNKSILKSTYSFLVKMKDSTWALVLTFCSWVGSIISEFCSQTLQRSQQHFLRVLPGLWGGLRCLSGVKFCCPHSNINRTSRTHSAAVWEGPDFWDEGANAIWASFPLEQIKASEEKVVWHWVLYTCAALYSCSFHFFFLFKNSYLEGQQKQSSSL